MLTVMTETMDTPFSAQADTFLLQYSLHKARKPDLLAFHSAALSRAVEQ